MLQDTTNRIDWRPNLRNNKLHKAVYGWSGNGTGIVAKCDKKGIFLTEDNPLTSIKCKSCERL